MRKTENTTMGHPGAPTDRCASIGERRGPAPSLLAVHSLRIGGEEWFILTHPLGSHPGGPMGAAKLEASESASHPAGRGLTSLPTALREVAALAMTGLDNAAIARARGTSSRTVAKQLEGIYRRLGVGSRLELITRYGEPLADVS